MEGWLVGIGSNAARIIFEGRDGGGKRGVGNCGEAEGVGGREDVFIVSRKPVTFGFLG